MKNGGSSTSHLDYIKKRNLNCIVNLIHARGTMSRAQVAAEIGLSKSAVSSLVDELLEKGIILETGIGRSTTQGGRRSILLSFNPNHRLCVGINITARSVTILISNLDGEIRSCDRFPGSVEASKILDYIQACFDNHEVDLESIAGIGIAVPGITDFHTGIVVESPSLGWVNLNLASYIAEQYEIPVFVLNDVDCMALGENWIGSAVDKKNIYFVGINDGLGGALIINGQLYTGSSGRSGEIGYTILDSSHKDWSCNCFGRYGWLEQTVSGWALHKTNLPLDMLFKSYLQGGSEAAPEVEMFIQNLSIMISNGVALLNPDCVIIGGKVAEYMGEIMPIISENVARIVPISTEIRMAKLGEKAHNFGAISHILKNVDLTD